MVISAICMPSNLIVYNSRDMIVVICAISMPSNLIVYISRNMIVLISAICIPSKLLYIIAEICLCPLVLFVCHHW